MIFEDVSLLQEKIRSGRPDGARLADSLSRDGEVDLLFTSSPPLFNQIATFELESLFRTELEPRQKAKDEADKAAAAKAAAEAAAVKAAAEAAAAAKAAADAVAAGELVSAADELKSLLSKPIREEDMFRKVPVPSTDGGSSSSSSSSSSLLTKYLRSPHLGSAVGGGTKLTIYLPDCSSMVVYVPETSTYEQVVNKVLATHKAKGLQPALKYDEPGDYELYLNEGDGIPDRDFVFRKTQRISENKVDEYCLCEADEDDDENPVPTTTAFSIGGRSSMMRFDSIGSASSLPTLQSNTVSVAIPTSKGDSITVRLVYDDTTTMKQLLLDLVEKKKHKIRLYTEEFSFVVSAEDQARLKLMSPFVDMSALVATFGDNCKFDLQKKIFEDSARALNRLRNLVKAKALEDSKKGVNPAARGTLVAGGGMGGGGGGGGMRSGAGAVGVGGAGGGGATGAASNNVNNSTSAFNSSGGGSRGSMSVTSVVYNETTATMHQQWNIVKKNKLGSKQERIIGIDGKFIYNSKRDQRAGTGVKVPMRDISLVQSVEVLDDKLTFRINWKEDKANAYVIEYVAQNERDCAEIAAKLNKLLSMQSARRVSGRGLGGR